MFVFVMLAARVTRAQGASEFEPQKKQPFVNRIVLEGNHFYSDKELKRQMYTKQASFFSVFHKPRLRRDFLRRDIAVLEGFYHANGFLDATVNLKEIRELKNGTFVDVIIEIDEHQPTKVAKIEFSDTSPFKKVDLTKDLLLKPGVPYNPSMIASDIYAIKRNYFEKGFLAVEVRDTTNADDHNVTIHYNIVRGPVIRIHDIEIRGNVMTRTSIIKKELAFKSGEDFRLSKVLETQRNLFETGLFTEAEISPEKLDEKARTVDIVVRVRERKPAYVEAGFGVGNVLGSRVTAEWGNRNVFGTGRRLVFKTEYSFSLFRNGNVSLHDINPEVKFYRYDGEFNQRHLLGTKVLLALNFFLEKDATVEDIVIRTTGASIGGRRRLSPSTDFLLQLSQERIKRESPDVGNEKSTSNLVSSTISHDTRDFILDPHTGGYRDLAVVVGGSILGGDNDFYTAISSYQRYRRLSRNTVLAWRVRGGFADAFGATADRGVPIENRFFTGGGNSVRGYDENSLGPRNVPSSGTPAVNIGGRALLLTNVEMRFPLPLLSRWNFFGAAFVDGGNVWASLGSIQWKDFRPYAKKADVLQEDYRYSVGLGLRYNTPIGPIRLDFGVPVKKEPGVDTSGRFHISLGQMF
jgi:outer membrane protein insertion porin family